MKWSQAKIKETFEELQQNGWDTSEDLSWGFVFNASDKEKLYNIFEELKGYNYEITKLEHTHNSDAWELHIAKDEALTFDELHRRNVEFAEIAHFFNARYMGWDVEKID